MNFPNDKWCWTSFSILICHFYNFFVKYFLHVFSLFSNWTVWFFFTFEFWKFLKLDMCKIFLSVYTLSFHLNNRVFDRTKVFNFDKVQLMNFTLWIMLSVSSLTHCLAIDSDNFLGFFSLKLLHFTFKYVNHFEFFFFNMVWDLSRGLFYLFTYACPNTSASFVEKTFFNWTAFAVLTNQWICFCSSIFGLSSLFHWSVSLFL